MEPFQDVCRCVTHRPPKAWKQSGQPSVLSCWLCCEPISDTLWLKYLGFSLIPTEFCPSFPVPSLLLSGRCLASPVAGRSKLPDRREFVLKVGLESTSNVATAADLGRGRFLYFSLSSSVNSGSDLSAAWLSFAEICRDSTDLLRFIFPRLSFFLLFSPWSTGKRYSPLSFVSSPSGLPRIGPFCKPFRLELLLPTIASFDDLRFFFLFGTCASTFQARK